MKYKIAINGSRAKSGGAKSHIIGLLSHVNIDLYQFDEIHLWAYDELLKDIPNFKWLVKHKSPKSDSNIIFQLFWERFLLAKHLKSFGCNILINLDAGSLCRFKPFIAMSRDMLCYEPGIMNKYFFSKAWIRLFLLKYLQVNTINNAYSVIFLTEYASNVIQKFTHNLKSFVIINHGVSDDFRVISSKRISNENSVNVVYVSNIDLYKHQDNIAEAIIRLNENGYDVVLNLVGAIEQNKTFRHLIQIRKEHNAHDKIILHGAVSHNKIIDHINKNDLFIYGSSCENMPNTLIEAMSSRIPILCSNRGPMQEVLGKWDYYFDPESVDSIYTSLVKMIENKNEWSFIANIAFERSMKYSWRRCSEETFSHIDALMKNLEIN